MIVKNLHTAPIFVPFPTPRTLFVGNNEIPTAEYKVLRPHIGDLIENGLLSEVSGDVPVVKGKDGAEDVGDVSKVKEYTAAPPETRKGYIKDCVNLATLDAWLESEKDPSVRLVIERRIVEIKEYKGPEADK